MSLEKDTEIIYQNSRVLQLVVAVRYQPTVKDNDAIAQQLANKITDPIDDASTALNKVITHIPGILQEQLKETVPIDTGINYFENYSQSWDPFFDQIKQDLKNINNQNEIILHEYKSEHIHQEATQLRNKIEEKLQAWKDQTYQIHFIGLAAGGNIIHKVADELINQNIINSKSCIASLWSVSTSLQDQYAVPKESSSRIGSIINYKSIFDLNSRCIQYSKRPDELIQWINMQNRTPFKYVLQALEFKLVKIITILLNGLKINSNEGLNPLLEMTNSIKIELQELIAEVKNLANYMAGNFKHFLQLPEINQTISEQFSQFGNIGDLAVERLQLFKENLKKIKSNDSANLDTERANVGLIFNCFVPLVHLIAQLLTSVSIDLKDKNKRKDFYKLLESDQFNKPNNLYDQALLLKDPYNYVIIKNAKERKEANHSEQSASAQDEVTAMIWNAEQAVTKIVEQKSQEQVCYLGHLLVLPVIQSKLAIIGQLIELVGMNNKSSMIDKIKSNSLLAKPIQFLQNNGKYNIKLDDTPSDDIRVMGLQHALNNLDVKINDLKKYFNASTYQIDPSYNSLHFIFNSHNLSLKEPPADLKQRLYLSTGIHNYKTAQGFTYDFLKNEYQAPINGIKTYEPMLVTENEKN